MNIILKNTTFSNVAVWNSMKLHLDLLINSGKKLTFYINQLIDEERLRKQYPQESIIKYSSYFSLYFKMKKEESYFCHEIFSVLFTSIFFIFSKPRICFWVQGLIPEESYMRNSSIFNFKLLSFLEKLAIKRADFKIFVSKSMLCFYQDKYRLKINRYIIIPCKSEFDLTSNQYRKKNSFVYIGGLAAWQKVDQALVFFKKIKDTYIEATLDIITLDIENAKRLVKNKTLNEKEIYNSIKIYSINNRKKIPEILSQFQFGFLLRDENVVNKVSSPIKFAEYLSCGINVICSSSIPHYSKILTEFDCGYVVNLESYDDKITKLEYKEGNSLEAYRCHFSNDIFLERYKSLF